MSTRTDLISLESLEPIRKVIASKDQALVEILVSASGVDFPEFRTYAESMILAPSSPVREPGCWNFLVLPLARHFGLSPKKLPLDDWKHHDIWPDYRTLVESHLSEEGRRFLFFLEKGRPFIGLEVEDDGCLFAWLNADEAGRLLNELEGIDQGVFNSYPFDDFHEELTVCLKQTVERNAELFLGAQ